MVSVLTFLIIVLLMVPINCKNFANFSSTSLNCPRIKLCYKDLASKIADTGRLMICSPPSAHITATRRFHRRSVYSTVVYTPSTRTLRYHPTFLLKEREVTALASLKRNPFFQKLLTSRYIVESDGNETPGNRQGEIHAAYFSFLYRARK